MNDNGVGVELSATTTNPSVQSTPTPPAASPYPGASIPAHGRWFRLLILAESALVDSPLQAELRLVDLDNAGDFIALSYVWGVVDTSSPRHIISNGFPIEITENCYQALCHIRCRVPRAVIWVDAVCINQADDSERGHQVRYMGDIYSLASCVYVWLSPAAKRRVPLTYPWVVERRARRYRRVPLAMARATSRETYQNELRRYRGLFWADARHGDQSATLEAILGAWHRRAPEGWWFTLDSSLIEAWLAFPRSHLGARGAEQSQTATCKSYADAIVAAYNDLDKEPRITRRTFYLAHAVLFVVLMITTACLVAFVLAPLGSPTLAWSAVLSFSGVGTLCLLNLKLTYINIFKQRPDWVETNPSGLGSNLGTLLVVQHALRTRVCLRPHDKCFALFGVLERCGATLEPPDYSKEPYEVYKAFLVNLLGWDTRALLLIEDAVSSLAQRGPSWVPDWSSGTDDRYVQIATTTPPPRTIDQSASSAPGISVEVLENTILRVEARRAYKIFFCTTTGAYSSHQSASSVLWAMVERIALWLYGSHRRFDDWIGKTFGPRMSVFAVYRGGSASSSKPGITYYIMLIRKFLWRRRFDRHRPLPANWLSELRTEIESSYLWRQPYYLGVWSFTTFVKFAREDEHHLFTTTNGTPGFATREVKEGDQVWSMGGLRQTKSFDECGGKNPLASYKV
ncbi:heterokaryon incompatibility protein-domain-containing protein [Microdochium trichocladiopsis]|uniref:Heterokaryon incompatibility protein-domain-containing protein n=1 Tax=Microdochium trichocladiopsis TaxID=1682393 RepID=A0A9P9BQK2_9PEZI|nr:heterokaryon incompatibility protein-domain-containing protein [Microdochium trichocladiopsis]KAH7025962.1 heterokaryon incompatibility protein-domain-containing protein [Microdochium trichocladiopsis]